MAEENNPKESTKNEGNEEQKENKPKTSGKKLIFVITLLIVVVCGAGAYFTGIVGGSKNQKNSTQNQEKTVSPQENKIFYYDLDEFIVNLKRTSSQPNFLKMSVTLEIKGKKNINIVDDKIPVIRDTFQTYIRELRSEDLQGSAGIFRLRQELLIRLNKIMYPVNINDVLFREILVQ